jgi:hypothetical protein
VEHEPSVARRIIQRTNTTKDLNGLFILWGFLIVVQIYGKNSYLLFFYLKLFTYLCGMKFKINPTQAVILYFILVVIIMYTLIKTNIL